MQKHKLSIIFYGIIITFFFISPLKGKATNVCNKDSYNTLLAPYASQVIRKQLGTYHQYSLTETKVIKVERYPKGTFNFLVTTEYHTYVNAHNPPNYKVTITFNIDPSGVKVKTVKQQKE
ncbi:DUF3888 domain-containing protein [Bacillus pseudomycoides]|uniref:DUF3888 domain-containing protein n=1 Tax=Bacillus pseudomycoides TaxID=64104 RepID=UPI000BEBD15C|nr:DUF3888 domain-containing protein [Bacillus pseudomycoides]PEF22872.1 hypothetical protein CON69_19945 [Bacillus pseudomycoides]PFW87777.1 hypothetical protein COL29_28860 [Bacillus pseudomycoides]PFX35685.1 hypothetical protein COL32_30115 [Bacillus pseudomycoides]PFY90068.1 hypothetical protein COL53_18635 [Bacillus pseudomycoides]PGD69882.1 hypothetical protein COM46_29060 [Bacillus pseudomycoides]